MIAAALVLLLVAGCKQPVGGRCQSHDDCESGVCSVAVPRTCRESGGGSDDFQIERARAPNCDVPPQRVLVRKERPREQITNDDDGQRALAIAFIDLTGYTEMTASGGDEQAARSATLLQNGRVLVAGGSDDGDLASILSDAELYDPVAGTWSTTRNLNTAVVSHTATLLQTGKVLIAGGYQPRFLHGFAAPISLDKAQLYDPATGTWSNTGTSHASDRAISRCSSSRATSPAPSSAATASRKRTSPASPTPSRSTTTS
jgi:hypothetical protein